MKEKKAVEVTMRDYVDNQLTDVRRSFDAAVIDIRRAVDKAESSMNERLAGMNEFRASLKDAQNKYMTRDEYWAAHNTLCKKMDDLQTLADVNRGKASMNSVYIAWLLAALSLIVSVIKLLK